MILMGIYDGCGMGPWQPGFIRRISGNYPTGFGSDGTCQACDGEGSLIVNSIGERTQCYNCDGKGYKDDQVSLCVHECEELLPRCPVDGCDEEAKLLGPEPGQMYSDTLDQYKVSCSGCDMDTPRSKKEKAIQTWKKICN